MLFERMLEKQKQDHRIQVTAETSVFEIVVEIARRRASLYAISSWQCAKVIIKKWPHAFVCICVCGSYIYSYIYNYKNNYEICSCKSCISFTTLQVHHEEART